MRWWLLMLAGCVTATPVKPAPRPDLYVDASAAEGGEGTVEQPFRALTLRPGARVHVASGLYAFSGALPDDVEVVGAGEVVLHAEGDAPAVVSAVRARLEHLNVQGGQWGVDCNGEVTLVDVSFSGQRQGAALLRSGRLTFSGKVEGTLPDTVGLRALKGTRLEVHGGGFSGSLKRAVDAEDATVNVDGLHTDGPAQALHALGGTATVRNASASRGSGAAFYVARGRLELRQVEVIGHEYAVLTGDQADLLVEGLRSERAQIAAVSVVLSRASVTDLRAVSPGSHGAVESLESTTTVKRVEVTDATDQAVLVRRGTLNATDVTVTRLRGLPGDAVHVRDARATVVGVRANDVEGAGVGVTSVADAEVRDVRCTRCGHGALVVDRRSHVRAKGIVMVSADAPAVVAGDDAQVELDGVEAPGEGPLVWAECEGATKVTVYGAVKRERLSGACVEVK